MSRYTSQLAVEKVGNRFDLVLVAAQRAKELQLGARSLLTGDGPIVTALKEVEAGMYTKQDYLQYLLARKKHNENHSA